LRRPRPDVETIDVFLGLVALAVETVRSRAALAPAAPSIVVDATLETARRGWMLGSRSVAKAAELVSPAASLVARPPLVPQSWQPEFVVQASARRWRARRPQTVEAAEQWRDTTIQSVVTAVVEKLDLTQLVIDNVDLGQVVARALDAVDLNAISREELDLLGLAEYVIDGIDLPEIIRQSTGSVASETVRTVRMQSVDADVALQRIVDRVLLRRRARAGRSVETTASGGE
jgi:hypothetical protein